MHVGPYGPAFTSDSRRLITASLTHPVTIWDVATATEIGQIPALGTNNYSVALSPDERLLAVGGWDGTVKVWDLQSQRLVNGLPPHHIPVYRLCFLDCGKSLLSGAMVPHQQVEVKRWDAASWQEIPLGPIDLSMCYGIAQSPNQQFLALTYADKPVKVWDYASGRLAAALGAEGGWSPTFSPNGRLLAVAQGALARVWEVGSWRELAVLEQPANGIFSVAFSPDGKRLVTGVKVSGELQPGVRVWDYLVERDLIALYTRGGWMGWTEFSPDGNTLLAVSWYGVANLFRAPSWEEIEGAEKGQAAP